jgi:hypothetical protein
MVSRRKQELLLSYIILVISFSFAGKRKEKKSLAIFNMGAKGKGFLFTH